jgi:4-hydroxy-3-methylbut-2-enyl diphosphate reductase
MKVILAKKHGFCFGVQRAIDIAEQNPNSSTIGPLIHNQREINRLKDSFSINVIENIENEKNIESIKENSLIIRTHGISKDSMKKLKNSSKKIIDATCPFVTKPQDICEKMDKEGYQIIIYGDVNHPEVQGVKSYGKDVLVVSCVESIKDIKLKKKIALISQTTKKVAQFLQVADYLIRYNNEVRVFNTICNATFENQDSANELSLQVNMMIVIGGKNSSNNKQLFEICKKNCNDSYLIEGMDDLDNRWFDGKSNCGISAGASTPEWIIQEVIDKIKQL